MKKFKSYTFWISLLGAVIILINTLGSVFGFAVDELAITSIVTAVLGIFVTLGLVKKDKSKEDEKPQESTEDNLLDNSTQENLNTDISFSADKSKTSQNQQTSKDSPEEK